MFSSEKLIISDIVLNYFKDVLAAKLQNLQQDYKLVITGPISAGKSTVLEIIYQLLTMNNISSAPILEYINYDNEVGNTLLKRFITGETSNSTFQNYVLDNYVDQLSKINSHPTVYLFERTIDDAPMCFANIAHYEGRNLTDFDLLALVEKSKRIDQIYDVPSCLIQNNTAFIRVNGNSLDDILITVIDQIKNDLENGIYKRIIGLNASLNVSKLRIKKRNRDGESGYDDKYLLRIIKYYDRVYNKLEKNEKILITTFDSLIVE